MADILIPSKQPWLGKPVSEILFILLPPFISLLFIAVFPGLFQDNDKMPEVWWVVLILLVDVAHVYSTLYRTYFDRTTRKAQKSLLIVIPFIAFGAGIFVYSISPFLFWRLLAYLAVFHFVRQQYGFMRLYSRKENAPAWMVRVDKITIYYATIYPLIFWHLSAPRNFNWFVSGDFVYASSASVLLVAKLLYVVILITYIFKEMLFVKQVRSINIPKLSIILGTILSWYFGIVYFNGDLAFTLLNVVSHGIPYMALVWIFSHKAPKPDIEAKSPGKNRIKYSLLGFLGLIFLLAYIEEGLWDAFLWKEHQGIFGLFTFNGGPLLLNFIVPLLAVPQITHYIIDGYIWKVKKNAGQI